jgi:hypothetical protein
MVKRTPEERAAALIKMQMFKATPEFKMYEQEVLRIKDAVASGIYKETGEQLAKTAGVIHGLDLALNIEMFLGSKS